MIKHTAILLLLLMTAIVPAYAKKIETTEQLVSAMHKKYSGKWYKTLVFAQKTTTYKSDGITQNGIWYEALSMPGKLRVDYDPIESGGGVIYANGINNTFKDGKLVSSRPVDHALLVLGFDVYFQPVETTLAQIKKMKVDLSLIREDIWQNRDVYVVGAKQGDLRSPQFWIDKKNLYFVRLIQPVGKDGASVQEIEFNKYQKVKSGGWIAPEVVFIVNGKRVFLEEYYGIRTNVPLDENLFDPKQWMAVDRNYFQRK
jgi:outer membrane lipoprotein-sorting protein